MKPAEGIALFVVHLVGLAQQYAQISGTYRCVVAGRVVISHDVDVGAIPRAIRALHLGKPPAMLGRNDSGINATSEFGLLHSAARCLNEYPHPLPDTVFAGCLGVGMERSEPRDNAVLRVKLDIIERPFVSPDDEKALIPGRVIAVRSCILPSPESIRGSWRHACYYRR